MRQKQVVCSLVSIISTALKLAYNKNKLYKIFHPAICSSLIFRKVSGKFLHHILYMIFHEKCFSCYILFTDPTLLFDWLYFLRYWAICVLKLFVSQVVTSYILKLILPFYMIKKSRQNLNILKTKRAFKVKLFAPFLKSFQLPEIVLNLRVHLKWRCKKARGAKELNN